MCKSIYFKDDYEHNHAVMGVIAGFRRDNKIVERHKKIIALNKEEFKKVNKLYQKLRKRRNDLAHINKSKDFATIKEDLEKIIKDVEVLFNSGVLHTVHYK